MSEPKMECPRCHASVAVKITDRRGKEQRRCSQCNLVLDGPGSWRARSARGARAAAYTAEKGVKMGERQTCPECLTFLAPGETFCARHSRCHALGCNRERFGTEKVCGQHLSGARRRELVETTARGAVICPHCQTKGKVSARPAMRKSGISGGKVTGAVLTGGVSLLATGLSRKESVTEMWCGNCGMSWTVA